MENHKLLAQFGLSGAESSIYLAALELGESLPKHLAEKASVKRPTLYKLLPDLFSKGLLTQTIKGKRRYIVAEDPQLLIEKKQSELKMLEEKIPELQLLLRTAKIKPQIIFYEGIEGLKKIYVDNLRGKKPILEFVGLENIHPEIDAYVKNYYIPQRINRKIPIKIIISGETATQRFQLKTDPYALREVKTIDKEKFPIPLDSYIYGDSISFLVFRGDSEPIGAIIRSKEIATTIRSLFNLIWSRS